LEYYTYNLRVGYTWLLTYFEIERDKYRPSLLLATALQGANSMTAL